MSKKKFSVNGTFKDSVNTVKFLTERNQFINSAPAVIPTRTDDFGVNKVSKSLHPKEQSLVISKIVSLSSLIATIVVVTLSIVFYDLNAYLLPQIVLVVAMGAIVFLKHTENIKRLIHGTESKIGSKRRKDNA